MYLKNELPKELFKNFTAHYKELLRDFQEIEIELQLEINENDYLISSILQMNGSYSEALKFKLLDTSVLNIPIDDLKEVLVELFKINSALTSKILSTGKSIKFKNLLSLKYHKTSIHPFSAQITFRLERGYTQ